uniref:CHAT domain-containing tetratricopeptide repeat protein n=1 Tax=Streptomyces sp. HSW2009 TaxID=3142890 RepID=UPI0032EBDB13
MEAFIPCFLTGAKGLPEPLLPLLALAATPRALDLLQQVEVSGGSTDPAQLSFVVDLWQRLAQAVPTNHPDRFRYLSNLGVTLWFRFERVGDLADLDDAITAGRAAVQATPTSHPARADMLSDLVLLLHARFEKVGDAVDLDEVITTGRAAVQAAPANHSDRVQMLSNLGAALWFRFERVGDLADLDDAIATCQSAVRATPGDHPGRTEMLARLSKVLRARLDRGGDLAVLDEVITTERAMVEAMASNHPDRAGMLSNLGAALRERFDRGGDLADLDEAVTICRAAVQAAPSNHPDRTQMLSNLGAALHALFEWGGDLAVLDEAVTACRAAVQAAPGNHPQLARMLSNLGSALRVRFRWVGDLADLDEAVTICRAAVQATPSNHPDRAAVLSHLDATLFARFQRSGDLADLDEVITIGRAAIQATPADDPHRHIYLSHLGSSLAIRSQEVGGLAVLDEAVAIGRAAVQAVPSNHPNRARGLFNLGMSLRLRYEQAGDPADLDEAITTGQAAAQAIPANHPERTKTLSNLGMALRLRFERAGDPADLDSAVSAFEDALGVVSAAPWHRIETAWELAGLVSGSDTTRAADAAETAVRLLAEVTPRRLERSDQQHALSQFTGLAGDAAALALADPRGSRQERATRALRLLEAGRAVLIGQALDVRSDLTDLTERYPDLAARFARLRDQLDQPAPTGDRDMDADGAQQERAARDRHQLARDFAQTLAEIRSLEGFGSFALPPTAEELLTEAEQGPVVVFNISRYRSDALLLTQDGITHLECPQLTGEALIEQVNTFQQALHTVTSGESREQRRQAQDALTGVLQWLWDTAAGPVLDTLGYQRQPFDEADWQRVWWAPGGLLGLLPLHAAGYHTDPADAPDRRTVLDRVISSYTPTVRALRHTRQHTPVPDAPAQGLIVAMPTTPGLPGHGRLRHVGAEAKLLGRHLPGSVLLSEPDPAAPDSPSLSTPTKAAVLDHLRGCSIAHFSCHGASHPNDPSQSQLLLHDHESDPFTVASLAPVHLDHAQLAFLSACHTAAIDAADLVDEAIHLTSAFQLAGFPHVVGTLWEIDDQTAVTVADAFYGFLRLSTGAIDPSRAAWALHQAVRGLRDGLGMPAPLDRVKVPFLWAAYLHAGA